MQPLHDVTVASRDSDYKSNASTCNRSSGSRRSCTGSSSICSNPIRRCCSHGLSIVLLTLLVTAVTTTAAVGAASATAAVAAAAAGDESRQRPIPTQQPQRLYSLYQEIPRLKLYKACGLPLVLLLTRKCSRRGGVYMVEADPKFAYMTARQRERQNATRSILHMRLAKVNLSPRHLCFRSNYGVKNPFLDCCCSYCAESTVLSYCRYGRPPQRFPLRIPS